ncbi:MAG: hypothetical protein R3E03_03245 [Novosphingobium sp.]
MPDRGGAAASRAVLVEVDISRTKPFRAPLRMWREGQRLNLEQALRLGDELGEHIVTGHVDAVGLRVPRARRRRADRST